MKPPNSPHLASDPLLPSVIPAQLLAWLDRVGCDTAPLIERFGFPVGVRDQPFTLVPLSTLRAFGDAAALAADDPFVGLHAGEHGSSNLLDVLAFACSGVRTGREALEAFVRYVSSIHNALLFSLVDTPAGAEIRQRLPGHPDALGKQGNEHWVATFLSAVTQATGSRRIPVRVAFAHTAPKKRQEIVRVAGTTALVFGAGENALGFTHEMLDAPVRNTGSHLAAVLDQYATRTSLVVRPEHGFVARLREAIETRLPSGGPSVAEIAKALGMSTRTLQRRLTEERMSFATVLDAVRRDVSVAHVARRELSLDEIAARAGYSQKSAFFRSFRRWTGTTPRSRESPPKAK